jgi:hypothetical protein
MSFGDTGSAHVPDSDTLKDAAARRYRLKSIRIKSNLQTLGNPAKTGSQQQIHKIAKGEFLLRKPHLPYSIRLAYQ